MARKPKQPEEEAPLALLCSADEAASRIAERIERGRALLAAPIRNTEELETIRHEESKWSQYNGELLRRMFSSPAMAEEYFRFFGAVMSMGPRSLADRVDDLHADITDGINRLDSIRERLELIPIAQGVAHASGAPRAGTGDGTVFIVHGHDESARETIARFLEQLKLRPIILHEQASAGMTIIEKLERYATASFAVVLLTPDDLGTTADSPEDLQPRARQNVILELGYFVGRLGRDRVCALYRGPLELPSDFVGVVYVSLDDAGGWRLRLAKELKEAGFDIDLNLAL